MRYYVTIQMALLIRKKAKTTNMRRNLNDAFELHIEGAIERSSPLPLHSKAQLLRRGR